MRIFEGSPEVQDQQRKMLVALLHWIYTTDIEGLEFSEEYNLNLNEKATAWGFEEAKKYYGYETQKKGRRMPIANIGTWWCQLTPESAHDMMFLFIELCEADRYLSENEPLPSLSRSCSFLQYTLSERLDSEDDLDSLIRTAGKQDVLSQEEEQLAHFIRACRNDVSHNFWLETEWGLPVHDHAAICVVTLLNSVLDSWYRKEWYIKNTLSVQRCLRIIENEFGFEWDEEKRYWDYSTIKPQYERLQDLAEEGELLLENYYNRSK